ncbi:MAG: hypothetical protein AAGC55_17425 [Myxococcota bacterium]
MATLTALAELDNDRATRDLDLLDTWCRRAVRATALAKIFDDLAESS